jgi:hypothetical protein
MNTRIGVPVLVLTSWNGMHVQHNVQILCCATLDAAIQDTESFWFVNSRIQVVFKMSVVERNANAVQSLFCKEFCI